MMLCGDSNLLIQQRNTGHFGKKVVVDDVERLTLQRRTADENEGPRGLPLHVALLMTIITTPFKFRD
jgi:hypothetical protein